MVRKSSLELEASPIRDMLCVLPCAADNSIDDCYRFSTMTVRHVDGLRRFLATGASSNIPPVHSQALVRHWYLMFAIVSLSRPVDNTTLS